MKDEKSQLKIGIILSYINLGVGNLIPIFYTPIMLNLLGKSEYGLYKLSSNVTSYLSLISLGIGSAVTRYLIKEKTEKGEEAEKKIFGLFMIIFQVIALAAFLVGVFLTFNLDIWYKDSLTEVELQRMGILVFIMVINTALSFSLSPYVSIVTAHERFVFLQLMNIISTCFGPILNLVALFMGFASVGMTISTLILSVVSRVIYFIYVRNRMKIKPVYKELPLDILKEILVFSFWIFVGNVVGQLYNATDTVMIGAVQELGTDGVAVYNVGLTFNSIMLSLTIAISNVLSPKVNKMVFSGASGKELTDLAIKVGRLQCYIMMLIISGFIAFGRPFIFYYAGEGYMDAYWVAVLMMVPNMIPLAQSVCSGIIVAQNRHRFRSLMYLFIASINVIGTWILMKRYGIVGAAFMTGLALFIGQGFIMNWYYQKRSGLEIIRFWKEVGSTFIIPVCMCLVTVFGSYFIDFYDPVILCISIIVYTLIYGVLVYLFIMNSYEKDLFVGLIKKVLLKRGSYER